MIYNTLWTGLRNGWLISLLAKLNWFSFYQSNSTGAIDLKIDWSVLEEKLSFKILGLMFSSKLDWGSYIISVPKTASKKIEPLICFMKFLSPEVTLYLYKFTIQPCMEYCCPVWTSGRSCYLELLDKLQKQDCWSFICCLSLALVHCGNVVSLSLFYGYYFGRCSSELAQLVPLPYA